MSFFNISGFNSPPSRPFILSSPTSPFCTSPSQLQEVTLDQDFTFSNSMGLRSPGGPMRGRSVKEYEEQLSNLKKENFNLKLRIYFLEERMGTNFNLDKENVVKKNVELMVEVESLRKELQEKHELLCQAVKAMELEDEEHKKLVTEKEDIVSRYQEEMDNLKTQILDFKAENETLTAKCYQSETADLYASQAINLQDQAVKELEEKIKSLEEELFQEREHNEAIQLILDQNDVKVKTLTTQLEEANKKLASSEQDIKDLHFQVDESKAKCQGLHKKLQERAQIIEELNSENQELKKRQTELEKERKRLEKMKMASEHKAAELQCKLEASLSELKKSQELVVSKSPARRIGNTDDGLFSVSKSTTPPGSPQKDPFLMPSAISPLISPTSSPSPSVFVLEHNTDLVAVIEQFKTEREAQHQKIVKLKAEQMKACKIIKGMIDSRNKVNEEMSSLKQKNEKLEKDLEDVCSKLKSKRTTDSSSHSSNENSMEEQNGELVEHYKALTDELEEKNRLLMATLSEKDNQMKKSREQYEELLKTYKEKEEHIVDLEFELLARQDSKMEDNLENSVDNYIKQLKEKNEEIDVLKDKLLKRNCDLQGLVNNELWQKNREIEKLQKKQASRLLETKDCEIEKLQNDVEIKEKQLGLIKEKISELGIAIDIQNDQVNVESNLQSELERSEKLRSEATEMCTVLSKRLEDLAVFLDSLLKQKSVLGFLGHKENKRLRQIIDQSLDLSRSFTMSMIINPDQSLLQLTNISSFLESTKAEEDEEDVSASRFSIIPGNISLTYRSHLYRKDSEDKCQIIQALRQQIVNLKYELQLRDVELGKMSAGATVLTEVSSDKDECQELKSSLNTSTTLKYKSDNQSESESWSEPDRMVSRARMGLLDGSLRSPTTRKTVGHTSTESTEDEESHVNSRTGSGKKGVSNESRNTIIELHKQVCELDQKLNEKEIAYYETTKANNKLKHELANLEAKLNETEARLGEAEERKHEAEAKFEKLQKEKEELLEEFKMKDKEMNNKLNQIEVGKMEALGMAREAEEVAKIAKNEMKVAEVKLKTMQKQMVEVEENLKSGYEEKMHETQKKIKQMQNAAEMEIKSLHDTIQQIQIEYSLNYVKKCHVEEAVQEIERLKSDLEALEERMEDMSCEDQQSKKKLTEYEDKINVLRSDLDIATLQYSEAVLDKTKIANEKALIEQELNKSTLKEVDARKRLDEVEHELVQMKQSYHKQISTLQEHKSQLEVRISELESSNAELHNRLIKIQAGCGDQLSSTSLHSTPNFVNQIVSFRRQHSEHSGYLSEEHYVVEGITSGRSFSRLIPNVNIDIERNEANSSPDLGIESDHGRFSSLETHLTVQRPLLQTLELTESMSNLLELETGNVHEVVCEDTHCCRKTMEMSQENTDLKRKLLRTRRALEETVTQLTLANQRKKQVEKTICKQIHKTSQVLRKAKANLDSGSETDVYRK